MSSIYSVFILNIPLQCEDNNIDVLVTNNVLSSSLQYHYKFHLNGFKRRASPTECKKKSPIYKDVDFKKHLPKVCVYITIAQLHCIIHYLKQSKCLPKSVISLKCIHHILRK